MSYVLAAYKWPSNAELIDALATKLHYLDYDTPTVDVTYGRGVWWKRWRPRMLVEHDLKLDGVDFRRLPEEDETYGQVAFDPPYKLNGRPTPNVDERYGVDVRMTVKERHELIRDGITECNRVLERRGTLLVKCQNQVCNGVVHWQTYEFVKHAESLGLIFQDECLVLGYREQPKDRTRKPTVAELALGVTERQPSQQQHAARNYSSLLVFRKRR